MTFAAPQRHINTKVFKKGGTVSRLLWDQCKMCGYIFVLTLIYEFFCFLFLIIMRILAPSKKLIIIIIIFIITIIN